MPRAHRIAGCFAAWLTIAAGTTLPMSLAAEPAAAPNPFAAHNAYPWRLYGPDRLHRALAAELRHIEIDVTFDAARGQTVVTHDGKPRGDEPLLGELLEPLWRQWSDAAGNGYTLIIDFKIVHPELARQLTPLLEPHAALLSTLEKSPGAEFVPGKITVCLTGNNAVHDLYEASVPAGGRYLAFGDLGPGDWRADATDYVPDEPARFVRFLTFPYQVFMDAPGARGPEHFSRQRLDPVLRLARERGYRVRLYTINPGKNNDQGEPDLRLWEHCVAAGVPMISTDAYEIAQKWRPAWLARQHR